MTVKNTQYTRQIYLICYFCFELRFAAVDYKNSKILITGGAGFIGSNICQALVEKDADVICLDNFLTGKRKNIEGLLNKKNFTLIEGDIRDMETCQQAMEGVDYVLHQAALGSVPRSVHNPLTTNSINITGFLNVIWAAKEEQVKRFVYAASSSTYGDSTELPKVEDNIGKPLSPYAVTKLVNEHYAKVFSDLYGLETIGLRYFNVFGRHQDPNGAYAAAIPKFINAFLEGEAPVIYGDGEQTRDFTYVKNVIQANEKALEVDNKEALNTVYNIAYGESTSLNELVKVLKELLSEFKPEIAEIEVQYGPERKGDVKHSLASVDKAKKHLAYDPQYDLKKGLKEAIPWYYKNL